MSPLAAELTVLAGRLRRRSLDGALVSLLEVADRLDAIALELTDGAGA